MDHNHTLRLYETPAKIVKEWYLRGKDETDAIFQFVSYWFAFNQLYNYRVVDIESSSEINRIMKFCSDHRDALSAMIDFDGTYIKVFKERPVIPGTDIPGIIDWRSGGWHYVAERISEKCLRVKWCHSLSPEKIEKIARSYVDICDSSVQMKYRLSALFITMYHVRCNLFHGMKNPDAERDYRLVESSAEILGLCLPKLICETFMIDERDLSR